MRKIVSFETVMKRVEAVIDGASYCEISSLIMGTRSVTIDYYFCVDILSPDEIEHAQKDGYRTQCQDVWSLMEMGLEEYSTLRAALKIVGIPKGFKDTDEDMYKLYIGSGRDFIAEAFAKSDRFFEQEKECLKRCLDLHLFEQAYDWLTTEAMLYGIDF